jgi:hypothetical protein
MTKNTKSARHHWCPECVSERWADAEGCVHWLSPAGTLKRIRTNNLGVIGNGHMIKLGGRVRGLTQSDRSEQNYNGVFTFTSLDTYRITELGLRDGLTPQQIRALGGGAGQFSMVSGDPLASVGQVDEGVFVQDDWRILPQLTLTGGLRYEIQNNMGDRRSFAPRIGFAWAPGGQGRQQARTVVRGGFGMFYDRVGADLTLEASRLMACISGSTWSPIPISTPIFRRRLFFLKICSRLLSAWSTAIFAHLIPRRLP